MMAELRVEYISLLPEKAKVIGEHLQSQDIEKLTDDFHKLKGSGKTYGVPEISILGQTFERLCSMNTAKALELIPLAIRLLSEIHLQRSNSNAFDLSLDDEFKKVLQLTGSCD